MSCGTHRATYDYLDHSPLVGQITFDTNGTTVMTTTNGYDHLNRLTNTASLGGTGSTRSQFDYQYNPASQRTSVTNLDGSYWVYGYDSMGQVTSGKKYWSDGTPVAGQQFDYAFDDIGNRQTTTRDGRQATYSPNNLNQYTSRTVPGFVNVLGTATNTATVSLWSQDNLALYPPTTRKGDYFRGEMLFNNNTGALWLTITNVAVLSNDTGADIVTNIAGNLLLAKNPEAFTYDADGNLTSDGLWTNVWNGENRRITIESRSTLPSAAKVKEAWTLLPDGRWIERIVSTNNGMSYYPSQTNRYVWDHQVLLAVLDHTNGVVVSFMRGIDMSGSIQGAGGVGGALAVKAGTSAQCGAMANTTHFTCYDGNGNVMVLINAATGAESAHYEYGPFAESLRVTGPMAKLNPIRFSTQYADDVCDDIKYLYRDYTAWVGRWLSRDPIEEAGGESLYGFVHNSAINRIDPKGLAFLWDTFVGCATSIGAKQVDKYFDKLFACGALNSRLRGEKPKPGEPEAFDIDLCKGFSFKPDFEPGYTPTSLAKNIADCVLSSLKGKAIEEALKEITDPNKRKALQKLLETAADYAPEAQMNLTINARCKSKKLHVTLDYSATVKVGGASISSPAKTVGPYGCPSILNLDSHCGCCDGQKTQ